MQQHVERVLASEWPVDHLLDRAKARSYWEALRSGQRRYSGALVALLTMIGFLTDGEAFGAEHCASPMTPPRL
jgi:hypothetical protein